MPSATNYTIKDGSATPADTPFTNVQPAGGSLPAVWIAKTKGPSPATQPKVSMSSEQTASGRRSRMTVRTPYVVTGADGVTKVVAAAFTEVITTMPDAVPDDVRAHHWAYVSNSADVPQIADGSKTGYAAN